MSIQCRQIWLNSTTSHLDNSTYTLIGSVNLANRPSTHEEIVNNILLTICSSVDGRKNSYTDDLVLVRLFLSIHYGSLEVPMKCRQMKFNLINELNARNSHDSHDIPRQFGKYMKYLTRGVINILWQYPNNTVLSIGTGL